METKKERKTIVQGILFVVASAVLFGVNPSLQKLVLQEGVTPVALIGLNYFVVAVLSFGVCCAKRKSLYINRGQMGQLFAMGLLGMGGTSLLLNTAYGFLPVGVATMIHFLFPSVVCVAMSLIFRERFTWRKLSAILLSLGGLILMNASSSNLSTIGVLLALCSTFTYSAYVILNERGMTGLLPQPVKLVYISMAVAVPYTLFAMLTDATFPASTRALLMSLLIGVLYSLSIGFLNTGIRKIGATKASFISILEPITSVFLSTILFSYQLNAATIAGCCLIVGAILFVTKE